MYIRYTRKWFDRSGKKEAEFYPSGYPQPYTWLGLHSPRGKCIDIESHHRKILPKSSTSAKYPRSCYRIDRREIRMEYFSKIDALSLSLSLSLSLVVNSGNKYVACSINERCIGEGFVSKNQGILLRQ